ncbi:LacI family DNA-binding transcriptional regulator [Cellulomonas biazotea]|uniref:LacI family transcriptional regulator n=1 Tax=Cellulomonas biazotea TaxID=1709 RepID=A0A402DQ10_9CELL|nr:LacI family DNA-binding transcriptional regulator [Cellulomonas biazotea]GCE76232.1 LacI family transcriptional regulator [Cellulomonas biazotea]
MTTTRPTLRDVADAAGVAVSTASRALTRPGRITEDTAARVRAAADALGYTASPSGRALSSGRTGTVALVVPDVTNPFFFGIVRGVQNRLRADGYMHVLVDTEESVPAEERALRMLRASADGVVLAAPRVEDADLARWAREQPIVTINRPVDGDGVVLDTPGGAVQALEHLASLGHRRVAYASGPRTSWSDRHRRVALRPAARRLGVDLVVLGPYAPQREAGAAAADAACGADVTAVLAFNDLLAFGVLDRLTARGVDVPGAMSVVGCDDVFGADLVRPGLTTVAAPLERAGHRAADLLLSRLDRSGSRAGDSRGARGPLPPSVDLLPTHLVVRGTTGPAPV